MDTLIGQRIEQYEIREHIARGGMADVYLAYDVNLQRRVALKIMLPLLAADTQFAERFRREARTAAQLEHPNIVQVYGIGMTATNQPFIAMQYIDGSDLRKKLHQTKQSGIPFSTVEALHILRPIADALQVAHTASIIHRDLKPSNILLRSDGSPVMVDLGIAAVQTAPKLTNTGTLMGTPHYMSPEQARAAPLDGRSDLYSIGVILYELLTGQRPFEAKDPLAILHMHVYEQPTPISQLRTDLTPQTIKLVNDCIHKDPNLRPQTAADLLRLIDQALQAESVNTPRHPSTTPSPQTQPKSQKPSWLMPAGIITILLVIVAGTLYALSNPTEEPPVFPSQEANTQITTTDPSTPAPTITSLLDNEPTSTFAPLPTFTSPAQLTAATPTSPPPTETPLPTATPFLIEELTIGRSVNNTQIQATRFGDGPNVIIFIGGLHAGAAPNTVTLAQRAIKHFTQTPTDIPPPSPSTSSPTPTPTAPTPLAS